MMCRERAQRVKIVRRVFKRRYQVALVVPTDGSADGCRERLLHLRHTIAAFLQQLDVKRRVSLWTDAGEVAVHRHDEEATGH